MGRSRVGTATIHQVLNMGTRNWAHTRLMVFGALPIEVPMSVHASKWAETVRTVLAEIPTVENIDVTVDPDELPQGALAEEEGFVPVSDNLRGEFWPEPIGASIQFDLTIPPHLQVVTPAGKKKVGHDRFRVRTFYGYHGPCTIITLLGHGDPNLIQSAWAVNAVYRCLAASPVVSWGGSLQPLQAAPSCSAAALGRGGHKTGWGLADQLWDQDWPISCGTRIGSALEVDAFAAPEQLNLASSAASRSMRPSPRAAAPRRASRRAPGREVGRLAQKRMMMLAAPLITPELMVR